MTRPNILMFMPDQLRADAVGCFGGYAKTPNIDALAGGGVRFAQAFSQNSVCSPSRISMMTGWYPHVRGHRTLTHLIQPDEPNLLKMFKDAGYHVAWAGRRGDTFAKATQDQSTDRYGFAIRPATFHHFAPKDHESAWARAHFHGLRIADGVVLDFDEAAVQTAISWLTEGLPEPWVLFVALIFPHVPFEVEEPWFSLHDRDAMPPPVAADMTRKPAYMRRMAQRTRLDRLSLVDWRELKAVYAGMVSRVDDQLGRVLNAVAAQGASERTLNLFFTDHGEYLGDFGLVEKWPSGLDNCLLHNPLIVSGPGVVAGATCDAMIEMVDLLPTLSELCGLTVAHTHFGKSFSAQLGGSTAHHKPAVYAEGGFTAAEEHLLETADFPYDVKAAIQHEDPSFIGRAVAVRTPDWTYIHRLYDAPELYDRRTDPGEVRNLAGEPALAQIEQGLKDQVFAWFMETSDVIPWQADRRF